MANRGGQPGNQNARKHGFYSRTITETDKLKMEEAGDTEGLDWPYSFTAGLNK